MKSSNTLHPGVEIGLHPLSYAPLHEALDAYRQRMRLAYQTQFAFNSSLEQGVGHWSNKNFALAVVGTHTVFGKHTQLQIEFWSDGLIRVRDHEFTSEPILDAQGIRLPISAPFPLTEPAQYINFEYPNLDSLVQWLYGLIDSGSTHRYVDADTLLLELNQR